MSVKFVVGFIIVLTVKICTQAKDWLRIGFHNTCQNIIKNELIYNNHYAMVTFICLYTHYWNSSVHVSKIQGQFQHYCKNLSRWIEASIVVSQQIRLQELDLMCH